MHIVAKKIGGTLSYDAAELRKFLSKYSDGEEFFIDISHLSEVKSKDQLGYYWKAMVAVVAADLGWTKPAMHKWLKAECSYGVDVSDMDRKDFSEYIDRCRIRLAEEGIHVDTPEEYFSKLKGQTK